MAGHVPETLLNGALYYTRNSTVPFSTTQCDPSPVIRPYFWNSATFLHTAIQLWRVVNCATIGSSQQSPTVASC